MFFRIFNRSLKPSSLSKWNIKKGKIIAFCILMSYRKEFLEIFFWTRIERAGVITKSESCCKLCGNIHSHIVTIGTFFSFFWRIFESSDSLEKILYIIRSFDKWNMLYFAYALKCFKSLIMFFFRLNIWIIPKTYNIIFITELKDGHRNIRTTAHMHENLLSNLWPLIVKLMCENIRRNPLRESGENEVLRMMNVFPILLTNPLPNSSAGDIWKMRILKKRR